MMRLPIALALLLWSTAALAHDARSAAIEVDVIGSLVTVHLAVSQAGLHHAVEAAAGHALDASDAGYQALVADHLRHTLRLSADGRPIEVGDIGLRHGDHQTDARLVAELPDGALALAVTVESFEGVPDQQTVVRIRHGGETSRTVLSDTAGRTVSISLAAPDQPPVPTSGSGPRWAVVVGLVGLLALPFLFVARRRSAVAA